MWYLILRATKPHMSHLFFLCTKFQKFFSDLSSTSLLNSIQSISSFHCVLSFFSLNLFIYFWLRCVFVAACGLSLVAASGGCSLLQCAGFSLRWLLLLRSTGSRHAGFSSCGMWAQQLWLAGSRAQAQQLWHTGFAVPRHVGSSRTRDRTRVPCIGRQILNHCATREAAVICFLFLEVLLRLSSSFTPSSTMLSLFTIPYF